MAASAVSGLSGGGISSEDGTMFSEASLVNIEKAG
jgi:hypothetical protein